MNFPSSHNSVLNYHYTTPFCIQGSRLMTSKGVVGRFILNIPTLQLAVYSLFDSELPHSICFKATAAEINDKWVNA